MTLAERDIPESVVELIPEIVARENEIIAIHCSQDALTVAIPAEGFSAHDQERIQFILNRPINWERHPRNEICSAIDQHYLASDNESGGVENCQWKFRYQCPHRWRNFAITNDELIRYCPVCSRHVYWCADDADVTRHAKQGHCIAKPDGFGLELIGDVGIDGRGSTPGA